MRHTILGNTWDDQIASLASAANSWIARVQAAGVSATIDTSGATHTTVGSDVFKAKLTAVQTAGQAAINAANTAIAYGLTAQAQAAQTAGQNALNIAQQGAAMTSGTDATAWMQQAQQATDAANAAASTITQALNPAAGATPGGGGLPFNPGTASDGGSMPTGGGGGGGGGSYPDPFEDGASDQTSAVQRFRESGGTWDPFEDDDGGAAAADSGYSDEGAYAEEDPFADAGAVAEEDPFAAAEDGSSDGYTSEPQADRMAEAKELLNSYDPSTEEVMGAVVLSLPGSTSRTYMAGLDFLGMMATRTPPAAAKPVTASKSAIPAPPPATVRPLAPTAPVVHTPATQPPRSAPSSTATSSPASTPTPTTTTPAPTPATPTSTDTTTPAAPATPSSSSSSFDPGTAGGGYSGGGGGGMDDEGSSDSGGGGGGGYAGDPFDQEAGDFDPELLSEMVDDGEYDAEAYAEAEDVLGVEFKWYDVFNPAGYAIRAYQASDDPSAKQIGNVSSKVIHGQPSPAVAAKLAASKAKLARLQQQYRLHAQAVLQSSQAAPTAQDPLQDMSAAPDAAVISNPDGTESIVGLDELDLEVL
jgi:hypothetical protein